MTKEPGARSQEPGAESGTCPGRPGCRRFPAFAFLLASGFWLLAPAPADSFNPASLYGKDLMQGVYVRDSAVAIEKFALADRMERLKEWGKSADVYQEILTSYPDRVVPSQTDQENKIYQYTSVGTAVQERLARWPQEGLAVYRLRFEPEAAALVERARDSDVATLHRAVSHYFITESALKAAIRLTDLYLESGEFPAAAWLGDRLLTWHPSLDPARSPAVERPMLLFRTAIAYHLAGNAKLATEKLAELKEKHPAATGPVRGAEVELASTLEKELATVRPAIRRGGDRESWPMAFGSPDRARVPAAGASGGARLFSIEVTQPSLRTLQRGQQGDFAEQNRRDRKAGLMTGILPVIDHGEVFFSDNARIYAVGLESGMPLPGWAQTYPDGRYAVPNAWVTPRSQQYAVTVTDDAVLAILGQSDLYALAITGNYSQRETRLVCLDRKTGRENWSRQMRQLPDDVANLRTLDLIGSPLVVGENVYVLGRGGKGMQFEDAYVVCFDLADGAYKWATYLASASAMTQMWLDVDLGAVTNQNVSHLAYDSGRVYALTNLGALASLDAYDGSVIWLNIYPRDIAEANRMGGMGGFDRRWGARTNTGGTKPWSYNPVIVSQGKVFVLPTDGLHVLVYEAGSGVEVQRIKLSQFENCDTLLGVVDDKLVLAGSKWVFCVNWPSYDEKKPQTENLHWRKVFQKSQQPDDSIRGRGFVTAEHVYVPTAWQLQVLTLKSGALASQYPATGSWDGEEGPGNVVALGDHLLIAGPTANAEGPGEMRVTAYTDLAVATRKLDAAIAAAPSDPEPRLRYAEILFVGGKLDESLARLDEAIELLGGQGAMRHGPQRHRVFSNALGFAERLAKDNRNFGVELIDGLYDRAADAADGPAQQVAYRLSRAQFAQQSNRPAAELRLYQEILSDPQLRLVSGGRGPAAATAEKAIDELLKRNGPGLYEPYEAAAETALDQATQAAEPTSLLEVAQQYPNSRVARKALLLAATAYEQANDPRLATQVLRQAYFRNPDARDRGEVLEALARNYLAMGNRTEVAVARLQQAARAAPERKLSKPIRLPDGKRLEGVTLAAAHELVRSLQAQLQVRPLPHLKLPESPRERVEAFNPAPEAALPGVQTLCTPPLDAIRYDRVIAYRAGALGVFAVGTSQPLFSSPSVNQPPRGVAWVGPKSEQLLAWTDTKVVLIGPDGRTSWELELRSLPTVDVTAPAPLAGGEEPDAAVADNDEGGVEGQVIVDGNRVIIRREQPLALRNARLRQLRMRGAAVPVVANVPDADAPERIEQVQALADRVILGTSAGRVAAVELAAGKLLWQVRPTGGSINRLLATDDFVALRFVDDGNVQLAALDTFDGNMSWHRAFTGDASNAPLNLALAPEGTLVWLMPDRLCGKDLFQPGGALKFEIANIKTEGSATFASSSGADQLLIADGRIVAVSDNGAFVRVHSLETGKMLKSREDRDALLATRASGTAGTSGGRVSLRLVGPRLYIAGTNSIVSYNLDHLHEDWISGTDGDPRGDTNRVIRDLIVGRDHLLLLSEPAPMGGRRRRGEQIASNLRYQAFSRALIHDNQVETGVMDHSDSLSDPAGIVAWQAVDGGLYYLTGDQKLHFLRGEGK